MRRRLLWSVGFVLVASSCSMTVEPPQGTSVAEHSRPPTSAATTTAPTPTTATLPAPQESVATSRTEPATTTTTVSPFAPPDWLGTRVLPLREDGLGKVLPTPPELQDRRFATPDHLPPPVTADYVWTIDPVPADVVARSTWREECPVALDGLRYLTFSHHGFDGELHTGELMVHASAAEDIIWVFGELFAAGFPIEELRVTRLDELDAPPTGDGNRSGAFGCRPVVGRQSGWSQHAYGLAIDINPFHNPYVKGDVVIPELASYYLDRSLDLPGMIGPDSVVVRAFESIGWKWGGNWTSLDDWMHFSRNGH